MAVIACFYHCKVLVNFKRNRIKPSEQVLKSLAQLGTCNWYLITNIRINDDCQLHCVPTVQLSKYNYDYFKNVIIAIDYNYKLELQHRWCVLIGVSHKYELYA